MTRLNLLVAIVLLGAVLLDSAMCVASDASRSSPLMGVNFAGAAFGADKIPGRPGWDYFYPKSESLSYFASAGMTVVRLCVLWERLQPVLGAALDDPEMNRIDAFIDEATAKGIRVIVDVHNYAKYRSDMIGSRQVPVERFADLWARIASRYKDRASVIFGLMNEPVHLPTETWLEAANAAIRTIRDAGANNTILVPGNGWSSAHDWASSSYGTPNATVMAAISDPRDNYVFEVHQYFDPGLSGTKKNCISAADATRALQGFTEWARKIHKNAFLGEFGVGTDANCLEVLESVLAFMKRNSDVWIGWTYWAAGPWARDYFTTLEPDQSGDRPQMSVLRRHLSK